MSKPLGHLQLQVMELLWQRDHATVSELHEELSRRRKLAYTTVLTTMQSLERRGSVTHERAGKAYVYHPAISRRQYTVACVAKLLDDLFSGEKERLLCHLLGDESPTQADLEQIERILQRRQGERNSELADPP